MLNIVIPMAGAGSRFAQAGFSDPKPLVPVHGIPMIRLVISNLRPACEHRFIFIAQNEHRMRYDLDKMLSDWAPGCQIMGLDGLTEGAACTVLKAGDIIDTDEPLMIANSDQYVDSPIDAYLQKIDGKDGLVMTMAANDPKWSFVEADSEGHIRRIVEKEVISDQATAGIYNFAHGRDFVRAAEAMIGAGARVNGEFYVAPAYNVLISEGKRIATHSIGSVGAGMHGLGTPADLADFLQSPLSRAAAERA